MIKFDPTIALHLFCVITFSHRPIFLIKMKIKNKTTQKKYFTKTPLLYKPAVPLLTKIINMPFPSHIILVNIRLCLGKLYPHKWVF